MSDDSSRWWPVIVGHQTPLEIEPLESLHPKNKITWICLTWICTFCHSKSPFFCHHLGKQLCVFFQLFPSKSKDKLPWFRGLKLDVTLKPKKIRIHAFPFERYTDTPRARATPTAIPPFMKAIPKRLTGGVPKGVPLKNRANDDPSSSIWVQIILSSFRSVRVVQESTKRCFCTGRGSQGVTKKLRPSESMGFSRLCGSKSHSDPDHPSLSGFEGCFTIF